MLGDDTTSSLSSSSFFTPLIITITISVFTFTFTISLLFKTKTQSQTQTQNQPTPCPQSLPILGNLLSFLRNHHRFHDWVADMLSETPSSTLRVHTFLNLSKGVCTANPDNVRHMLSSNFSNYVKGSRFHTVLNELLGNGIFAVDGHLWSYQRKVASYEFSTNSLKSFISDTVNLQIVNRLIPYLSKACDEERIINLQDVLQKFSFDNVCRVAFGVDPCSLEANSETFSGNERQSESNFFSAFDDAVAICFSRFTSPFPFLWKLMRCLNIGSEKRFKHDIELINNFAMKIIQSKEQAIAKSSSDQDLLTRFMSSISDSEFRNREEKRKFLRDVIISFVLAGKDSTATALTWFFWLLAGNPSSVCKILTELSNFNGNANSDDNSRARVRVFSYAELKKLNYLHAAVSETLRLFPPVPINSRLTVDDDVWPDGTHVARGWFADYSAYAMGRNDRVWGEHCREFRAERWLDDEGKYQPLDPFKFPVFHCGPRMCLGKDMAYVQMKSVIAAVLGEFEVLPVDGGACEEKMVNPPYVLSLLLKMRGGLPVRLRRRYREG